MRGLRSILAICLALLMVVAPFSTGWAGDPSPADPGSSNPADSGHPWDDEANETIDPGDTPDDGTLISDRGFNPVRTATAPAFMLNGGSRWIAQVVFYLWDFARSSEILWKKTSVTDPWRVR